MSPGSWAKEFAGAVTVCDADGTIVEMNDRAARSFDREGGRKLIGTNVLDCHPEPARATLAALMSERRANTYTIEKKGVRRLVHQAPWFRDGRYAGFVELVLDIPAELPHFKRD